MLLLVESSIVDLVNSEKIQRSKGGKYYGNI